MNEHQELADDERPKRSRISLIAIILILVIIAGACVSTSYSRTLSRLLREQKDFARLMGEMKIEDPSKVGIVALPTEVMDLPAWVDPENLRIFRVYIPANYGIALSNNTGLVAADSPLSWSSGGGRSSGPDPEPKEIRIAINTEMSNGRAQFVLQSDSGSTSFLLPKKMKLDSPNDLVLDTAVAPGEPMRTFDANEAICLWRLRNKTPGKKVINDTKLYPGCAIYLLKRANRDAFNRWASGKSSSMTVPKPPATKSD